MRKRKPSLPRLKKKLWDIFSKVIRLREADEEGYVKCFTCGNGDHWKAMDAGHYISKSLGLSIYFEEKNVHPQDTACNRFRHGNLAQYALALQKKYGPGILDELDSIRRQVKKFSRSDYEEMIDKYKRELINLEARQSGITFGAH